MTGSEGSRSSHADELQASRIRQLNDQFRTHFTGGKVMITRGIEALGPVAVLGIMSKIRAFRNFDDNNDPHGEHDFGAIEWSGDTIFWKIDYYDSDCTMGSPDPSDPDVTCRVLTFMLAWEY